MSEADTVIQQPGHTADQCGMSPVEIKAALMIRGITFKKIAADLGVTSGAITQTVHQYQSGKKYKGFRVRQYIAQALNKQVDEIWPNIN